MICWQESLSIGVGYAMLVHCSKCWHESWPIPCWTYNVGPTLVQRTNVDMKISHFVLSNVSNVGPTLVQLLVCWYERWVFGYLMLTRRLYIVVYVGIKKNPVYICGYLWLAQCQSNQVIYYIQHKTLLINLISSEHVSFVSKSVGQHVLNLQSWLSVGPLL